MPIANVNAQSFISNPSALLDLYELDSRYISVNGARYLFHPGVNGLYQNVIWNNETYTAFPLEIDEFAINGQGTAVRPKLRCSNINGFISAFLLGQGDLVGAKVTRTRVFARYLPHANFPNGKNPFGTPDPTAAYEPDVFYVNRKVTENPQIVELEITSPIELDNVQLPSRPMLATVCTFRFRDGETCGYSGIPVSDRFGKSFTDAVVNGGYGYTLNPRGTWDPSATYAIGDWVSIVSGGDFNNGDTLVYVCSVAGTTGSSNNPQFNETNWVADACPHNLLGCTAHFPFPAQLPAGFFAGTSRASFVN